MSIYLTNHQPFSKELRIMRYVNQTKKKSASATPEVVKLWGTTTGRTLSLWLTLSAKKVMHNSHL